MTSLTLIISHLNVLIEQIGLLNKLLLDDQRHFTGNDLHQIEENNLTKITINTQITTISQTLMTHAALTNYSGNLLEKIGQFSKTTQHAEQTQLNLLLARLDVESEKMIRLTTVNRMIINANLTHVKTLIHYLLHGKQFEETYTYSAVMPGLCGSVVKLR